MNDVRRQHLTDVQFSDLLAGERPDADAEAHLAECAHCRGELEAVQGSLGTFQTLGTAWAEAKAPAYVPVPSRWAVSLHSLPSWRAGLAAVAISGVLAFHFAAPRAHAPRSAADIAAAPTTAPSRAEIASDNQLMRSINQELNYQAQLAVPTAELHAGTQQSGRGVPESLVN